MVIKSSHLSIFDPNKETINNLELAEKLADYLEFGDLDEKKYAETITLALAYVAEANDLEVKETLLNGIANAMSQKYFPVGIDLTPLISQLQSLDNDCLLHFIDIIGMSKNIKYSSKLKELLLHRNYNIRESARLALSELEC
jgi:hypothetical protein